jgi:hypothetical protein
VAGIFAVTRMAAYFYPISEVEAGTFHVAGLFFYHNPIASESWRLQLLNKITFRLTIILTLKRIKAVSSYPPSLIKKAESP